MPLPTDHPEILIIGAGYLGSHLHRHLTEGGQRTALADLLAERSHPGMQVDMADEESVEHLSRLLLPTHPRTVIVCASARGGDASICEALYANGVGHLIVHFPSSRLVFCSSTSLYGVTDGRWVTEMHTSSPPGEEASYLYGAEQQILAAGGTVARLSAIYGPGRCKLLERYCLRGEALPGSPERWINYIHRDDAVSALALLAGMKDASGRLFNVTDSGPMQLGQIYGYLSGLLGKGEPRYLPASPRSRRGRTSQRVSCSLLMSCGWMPLYPCFADGVHNVLEQMEFPPDQSPSP